MWQVTTIHLIRNNDNNAHEVLCHQIVCCLALTFFLSTVSGHENKNSSTHQILYDVCFGSSASSVSVWLALMGLMVVVVPSTLTLGNNTCCPDNLSFKTITFMTALRLCRITKMKYTRALILISYSGAATTTITFVISLFGMNQTII